jgi:hypothetical protein
MLDFTELRDPSSDNPRISHAQETAMGRWAGHVSLAGSAAAVWAQASWTLVLALGVFAALAYALNARSTIQR